jgi:hypothetical protein
MGVYCRELYEMGFIPICPHLLFTQFLNDDIPEQRKAQAEMALGLLRRCRVLVVCSDEINEDMETEILLARRLEIVATTMDGVRRISQYGHMGASEFEKI